MEDVRASWQEVASQVEALGLKLKLHLEQEQDDAVQDRVEGETKNAFDEMAGKMTDAFDAFGNAAKDDGVQSDVHEIAELIRAALIKTFRAVGAEVEQIMDQIEDYAEDAAEKIADMIEGDSTPEIPEAVTDTVADVQDKV